MILCWINIQSIIVALSFSASDQKISTFIHVMKTQADDARIDTMTTASLILHLVSAALPEDDLNKAIKSTILERLRKDPEQSNLDPIFGKIKTFEAGAKSGMARTGKSNKNRMINPDEDQPKQRKC